MRNVFTIVILALLHIGAAYAQQDGPLSGPRAAPRIPEAASDAPVQTPGPVTGSPSAAGLQATVPPKPAERSEGREPFEGEKSKTGK
jgi:hypothetical protein